MDPRPPALAAWVMRLSLARADRDAVLGDLQEELATRTAAGGERAARRWYREQVARSLRYNLLQRLAWLRADGLLNDVKYALRSLRATPTFTVVALAVLALGIGATTAIFSVVDAVVLRGLPYPRGARLVALSEPSTGPHAGGSSVAAADFEDWRAQQTTFEDLAAVQGSSPPFVLRGGDGAYELRAAMVSASFFPLLRARAAVGQTFTREEERRRERVAVLSDACWRGRFAADPRIVGRTLAVESGTYTVIGVMPPAFGYPPAAARPVEVWIPYVPIPSELSRGDGSHRSSHAEVIGRLKDGVPLAAARADIERISGAIKQQTPRWFRDRRVAVTPMQDAIVGPVKSWMLMLLAAVGFVLLIACVNVANLLLARAASRSRDAAVRAALGASRWRILRARLAESLVLSVTGTVLGVALAGWAVSVLRATLPPSLPRLDEVAINYRVLVAAAAAEVAVALAVTPAWHGSPLALDVALGRGGRSVEGGMRHRVRIVLLVAEVALAGVLLIGSTLVMSSFARLVQVDLGFETGHLLSVDVSPPRSTRAGNGVFAPELAGSIVAVLERVRKLPGVERAALVVGAPPLDQGSDRRSVEVAGKPIFGGDDSPDDKSVTPDYFAVFRVPLVAGRSFTDADAAPGAPRVLMINDVAAARYFVGANPIGAELRISRVPDPFTIVGVVRAVRLQGPEGQLRPEIYRPLDRRQPLGSPDVTLVLRTSGDPALLAPDVRAIVRASAPDMIVPNPQTYDALFGKIVAQQKFNTCLLALFGALAIAIAGAGVYGVMAFMVEQRTQEIGVRIALGAEPGRVIRMVLLQAGACLGAGLTLAFGGGWMLARFVQGFLFRVDARDPRVYAAAAAVLLFAGLAAAFLPARRAARIDPVDALRAF
jgi:putative ABC transport system permease protein